MVKRMLIDATHAEETRVVVLNGSRLDEFDVETSTKRQLKGNIYLAKIVRVEPSLQAAFVEYGGGRHGFLAFNEIHPDYYQIPVADRQALIAEHRAAMRASGAAASADFDDGDGDEHRGRHRRRGGEESPERAASPEGGAADGDSGAPIDAHEFHGRAHHEHDHAEAHGESGTGGDADQGNDHASSPDDHAAEAHAPQEYGPPAPDYASGEDDHNLHGDEHTGAGEEARDSEGSHDMGAEHHGSDEHGDHSDGVPPTAAALMPVVEIAAPIETVDAGGGDDVEDVEPRRHRPLRHYKIQEVIKRRQIVLVQVVKEERGTKGAALTTYLSLAGRYCVLMPNTARGGGVSRKITNAADRKRLKTVVNELEIPDGMAVIIRTAGSERTKPEIKRDYEYLLRLWDSVRELTLQSTAPALVYEEANLIKRSIRDLYARDIDEILVEGDEGYRLAKDFMRMLTPSHAKKVQLYKDPAIPLFHRFQVEAQLDAMHSPSVQLKSGGYIVLNQTEALVAIDVNSGRATRERHIEETAFKTNMEAADEVARQLRLRDLAGLIVIDFIDMEESRNNHAVERRLKDAMRLDRARIQLGRISPFGLLELSRQRLRPSLMESSFQTCTHCGGTGMMRSVESSAVHVLRAIEDEGIRRRGGEIRVTVQTQVALYLLNQKRDALQAIEMRYVMRVLVVGDDSLIPPAHRIERTKTETPPELLARPVHMETGLIEAPVEAEVAEEVEEVEEEEAVPEEARPPQDHRRHEPHHAQGSEGEGGGRKRRRRRRRGRRDEGGQPIREISPASVARPDGEEVELAEPPSGDTGESAAPHAPPSPQQGGIEGEAAPRRRRRGKRGGRRRNRGRDGATGTPMGAEQPEHGSETEGGDYGFADESTDDAGEGMGGEPAATATESPAPTARQPREDHPAPAAERAASADSSLHAKRVEEPVARAEPQPAATPPVPPTPEPEQPAGPPRRGWWNRVI